jgi:tRNA-splicing endonuclease subunit Sen34
MSTSPAAIQISSVCGHYLIFDAASIDTLRRELQISGTLCGTSPQFPGQNCFLSLPLEIDHWAVRWLVDNRLGIVQDDRRYHEVASLRSLTDFMVGDHCGLLQESREEVSNSFSQGAASPTSLTVIPEPLGRSRNCFAPYDHREMQNNAIIASTTPSSSTARGGAKTLSRLSRLRIPKFDYITPGLRFGAQFSVYPGDPLRFHAHFLASMYGHSQKQPLLDIIGGGRLATGVKKGLLISSATLPPLSTSGPGPHVFCIEWSRI